MKIKNIFLLYIVLFFAICNSSAQVPGYLGKRFVASASLSTFPRVYYDGNMASTFFSKQGSYDKNFNTQYGFSFGYIISRLGILSLNYEHLSGGFKGGIFISALDNYLYTNYKYTGNGFGIEYTKFNSEKGALAPLGNYTRYQLQNIIVETSDSVDLAGGFAVSRINFPVFAMVFGRQAILFDNIYYDIGARVGLVLKNAPYFARFGDSVDKFNIPQQIGVRIRDQQLFNLFFRIGYLF